ncbi:MAG: kinase [Oenococcus sp.]|uniref:mevalonate kinase family protein n=1 Tax=Oenococcus TaxID=46254 RepID=UPI0021E6E323|nr:kinase [Oenococcus kitaharae]MCV3295885.1 kinase [Oenococcus kitaharae]
MSEMRVPGKLMLAGEYAVTVPKHLALVFSINRFISQTKSELVNRQGVKYGLGSSGAYAVLKTKSDNLLPLSDDELFYKALAFSRQQQPQNSGADIAASTYGGLLLYENGQLPIQARFPESWHLLVGWTGHPAVTSELVKNNQLSQSFIQTSDQIVRNMFTAIKDRNFAAFSQQMHLAEDNLEKLTGVMTQKIVQGIRAANRCGYQAKISGAGGGDNIIAFTEKIDDIPKIQQEWRRIGIVPLDLHVYYKK